jgi:hypothetical protein
MALYGDWGTGKTSAMRWLESQLQIWNASPDRDHDTHPHITPVWFYPWKYHQREDVWRGIIAEVILATLSISGDSAPPLPQRLAAAGKQFGKFLGHSFLHALANVKIKATVAGAGAELSGQIFQDLYNEYNQSARPHAPFLNDFEQQLTQWVGESFDGKKRRLVLFIDDLDRCLPGVALEVLEALKLYLNIPGLLFVVGLDRDVIDQLVIKHYQDNGVSPEKAAKYLAKLFQVEMDIHPSDHQSADFLTRKLAALDSFTGGTWNSCLTPGLDADAHVEKFRPAIESVITLLSRGNPREFTRLLNALLVKAGSAQASKGKAAPNIRFIQGAQSFLIERPPGRTHRLTPPPPLRALPGFPRKPLRGPPGKSPTLPLSIRPQIRWEERFPRPDQAISQAAGPAERTGPRQRHPRIRQHHSGSSRAGLRPAHLVHP